MKFKTIFIAASIIIAASSADAQKLGRMNIDYNNIEVGVTMNPQNYKDLKARFINGDSSLTDDEIAIVYYGYPATFDYNPKADYSYLHDDFDAKNYKAVLPKIKKELMKNPVSLDLLAMAAVASANSDELDDLLNVGKLQERFHMVINIIMASGKGFEQERPFYVLSESDARAFLKNVFGITDFKSASDGDLVAYLFKFPGNPRDNVLYFNVAPQNKH